MSILPRLAGLLLATGLALPAFADVAEDERARGLFAGVALDGAVLSIDDAANQAVYGQGTTPRMIFEGRAAQRPSNAVVSFRDQLEEASAAARLARNDGAVAPARPAVTTAPAATATPQAQPIEPAPQPQPFEPVDSPYSGDAIQTEPLPPTP